MSRIENDLIMMIMMEFKKIRIMSCIENYLTIETQTEDNDRRPSLAELQAEDRVSILSFKKNTYMYIIQRTE